MIVDQSYWDRSYEKYEFRELPENDPTKELIKKFVIDAEGDRTAFELGCFPGRFLLEIGRKGYELNGCDKNHRVTKDLPAWLSKNNCKVGSFQEIDYKDALDSKYDLVASFGFIEHFANWDEVLKHHCMMLETGGILIVQFPNFKGFIQKYLHLFFDKDNLNNHVLSSMNPAAYKKLLGQEYEILFCGYYGAFDFWIDDYKKRNGATKKRMLALLNRTRRIWKYLPNNSAWSPYGAIIVRKSQ